MAETRRKFDHDFREGAVRLVRETGKPIAEVARDLGINPGTLGNWVNADKRRRGDGSGALNEDERAELARLRRENAELALERDVLKRSVALWVLSRSRDKTHYAEDRIMARRSAGTVVRSQWGTAPWVASTLSLKASTSGRSTSNTRVRCGQGSRNARVSRPAASSTTWEHPAAVAAVR